MYRTIIIEYAPKLLLLILVVSATLKIYALATLRHADSYTELFFRSFFPYSRAIIKNTDHKRLQHFYKYSNEVNKYFYPVGLLILAIYALMRLI